MGGAGGGLGGGAPVPQRWLSFALLQAERLRRRRPPAGGGGGLFLPPSRRQEVSARPARCEEPGSWEQPQLDWKPGPAGGGRVCGGWIPGLGCPLCFPPPKPTLPGTPPHIPGSSHWWPCCPPAVLQSPPMLMGLSGSRQKGGPCCSPWEPPGPNGVRVGGGDGCSSPRLPPPLFTRRLPPRKLNPPAVILFGNFGQLL